MKYIQQIFLGRNFFYGILSIVIFYVMGFYFPWIINLANFLLFAFILLILIDLYLLFSSKKGIEGQRILNEKLSNFDTNPVKISLENHFNFKVKITVIDELPIQFQIFDFKIEEQIDPNRAKTISYQLKPTERGLYEFGNTNVFVSSPLRILERRIVLNTQSSIKVFPSFLRLNQLSLYNFKAHLNELGVKKSRRIGHSMEFEQIKDYVLGDDIRTINWKATAKHQKLMVNQYVDEKSQQIYCAIDKGRLMKMPFDGLSLLDYAINATLVFSNIVLQNQDRAGMFTFSNQMEDLIKAERRSDQLQKISSGLYNIKSNFIESDFGMLYNTLKYKITQRSLILLFTNFESLDSMQRQLPYLKAINKNHLLIITFFKNTELENYLNAPKKQIDPYQKGLIEKFIYEKQQIVLELNKHGIQTILTRPEDLEIDTINKYLEIKSRGMI